jgi:uncharacterized protein (DUF924 family)
MIDMPSPQSIVSFWQQAGEDKWYARDDALDRRIRQRFLTIYEEAARGALTSWEDNAQSALALMILLDQFPRNMFRGNARAFATDALALDIARRALDQGFDRAVDPVMRGFFYLPFMHSENLADQAWAIGLYEALGNENNLKYANIHADIIRKFGRFPHRNDVLGRTTTPEEQAFLDGGGFKG